VLCHTREADLKDGTSTVVSDTNSVNNSTAEDTMTSTVYYETTKLAGLFQKSPPMPLFKNHCVHERDDIHKILQTLQQEQEQQQLQLHEFVSNNNSAHGRLVVCSQNRSKDNVKKDLFGSKQATATTTMNARPPKTIPHKTYEAPPPAVYCSSSNSSEGSKGVVGRRITKQARQE
jgi:hypothetical protein